MGQLGIWFELRDERGAMGESLWGSDAGMLRDKYGIEWIIVAGKLVNLVGEYLSFLYVCFEVTQFK